MSKYLFEISWEVANKVGGIYTVLRTKARYVKNKFGRNYFVVGPYLGAKSESEFRFLEVPSEFKSIVSNLERKGIIVYFGEWLIEELPNGFLIDFQKFFHDINFVKYELWEKFAVDSLRTGQDYNEPIAWSKAVSEFIKELNNNSEFQNSIFHFHEWLSGAGLLFIKDLNKKTVFTTHATVLGRTLASLNIDFWQEEIDPDEIAYNFGVEAKHQVEKNSAKFCTYMTTVSNITALEVEKFLQRKTDFVLPNGIDLSKYSTFEEIANSHRKNKNLTYEFILEFFNPYFRKSCPIRNSLLFFISGRKEIRNKGIDIALSALGRLNKILKEKNINKNIYTFVFVPDNFLDINHEILENLNTYRSLKDYLENIQEEINSRIFHALIHQRKIEEEKLFSNEECLEIQRILNKIKKGKIPFSTHILHHQNEFLKILKENELENKEDDRIKVILYPIYLSSTDGFLNLNYEDAINGCHLGIFVSFYEPWGYTALETLAAGTMAIASDLTGFASYVEENKLLNSEYPGLFILKRKNRKDDEAINNLVEIFLKIINMERAERVQNKFEARSLANHFDWQNMIKNYFKVYELLFEK